MSEATAATAWREELAALVRGAPPWMSALASAELHIGGFTNVRLEHPVLDAGAAADDDAAACALAFFIAASVLHGAAVARVHCGRGGRGRALAEATRTRLRPAVERIDDANVALLRYFDVYLRPADAIGAAGGRKLARAVADALRSSQG